MGPDGQVLERLNTRATLIDGSLVRQPTRPRPAGQPPLEAEIQADVDQANLVFSNSGVLARRRVAGG